MCQDCGLRNVIQECTVNHNRECGKTCPKGYEFDINIDDCVEVESMIRTTTSTHSTKTVKLETNRKETTETQSKTKANDVTTTASSPSVKVKINSSRPLTGNYDSVNVSPTNKVQPGQDQHKAILTINYVLIALVIVFAPTILVLVIVIVHKKRQDHSTPRDEESTGKILTLKNWSKIVLVSPLVLPSGN